MTISKIHQIWFQGVEEIPKKYQDYRKSWYKNHPHSKFITWDEQKILALIKKEYPDCLEWFEKIPLMIQKIDVAKCFILDSHGGAYADMDTESVKPLYDLWDESQIVVGEIGWSWLESFIMKFVFKLKGTLINNGLIISPKKHPFWKFYIDCLRKTLAEPQLLEKVSKGLYVNVTTGPAHLTNAVYEFPSKDSIKILPPALLEPQLIYDGSKKYQDSYIIHHHGLTWCSTSTKNMIYIIHYIQKYWWLVLLALILLGVLIWWLIIR